MWSYEKRLQYPVNITSTNPKLAQVILSQFGGPDGENAAASRYLSQRYAMPYNNVAGILTDIGTEESEQRRGRLKKSPSLFVSYQMRNLISSSKGGESQPFMLTSFEPARCGRSR